MYQCATVQTVWRCISVPQCRLYGDVSVCHSADCMEMYQCATMQTVYSCISVPQCRLYGGVPVCHNTAYGDVPVCHNTAYGDVSVCQSVDCMKNCFCNNNILQLFINPSLYMC